MHCAAVTDAVRLAPSQLASRFIEHARAQGRWTLADITRIQRDWVRGRAARRATSASTSSTSTAGMATCRRSSCRRSTTAGPTDTAEASRTGPVSGWRLLADVREAVGHDCAIASRIAVHALGPAGVGLEEAIRFIAAADDLVDLWDVTVGSITEWSKDSGTSRFFQEGYELAWTGGVREATAKPVVGVGRLHQPRPDGRDRAQRGLGPHRFGPAVDRRPVPAAEDRGGPLRRDPRVHRLQRLRPAGRDHVPPRVHPERHRRRGVPPRLASRTFQPCGQRRPRRARGRRRDRRAWNARSCSASAGCTAVHLVEAEPSSAARCAGSRGSRASASGQGSSTGARSSSTGSPTSRSSAMSSSTRRQSSSTAPSLSSSPRGRRGRETA